jgi:hypothetical protein
MCWVKETKHAGTVPQNPAEVVQPMISRTSLPGRIALEPVNEQEVDSLWMALELVTEVYIGKIDAKHSCVQEWVPTN